MQLKLSRSQKETGIMSKTMVFCLDARVEYSDEERAAVTRHKLGKEVLYNSEAAKQHLAAMTGGIAEGTLMGSLKAMGRAAMAKMSLNITIDSLSNGQHVECKDMDELLAAEDTIRDACERLKLYLERAKTFDGKEMVVDY